MGASPGAIGAAGAQNQLKSVLTVCDMVLMGQPEIYFSYKAELFDEANNVRSEDVKKFLNSWWIASGHGSSCHSKHERVLRRVRTKAGAKPVQQRGNFILVRHFSRSCAGARLENEAPS